MRRILAIIFVLSFCVYAEAQFNIMEYKRIKEKDIENGTKNVTVSLINGTPALTIKKYDPNTGELLNNSIQIGVDIDKLKEQVVALQKQIDALNEFIADAESLLAVE